MYRSDMDSRRQLLKAVFVIPTIHPQEFFNCILQSLPHISNLKGMVGFALCCQSPWEESEAEAAKDYLESQGFQCQYTFAKSKEAGEVAPSMSRLRATAAALFPEVEYYIFGDDNMEFSGGTPMFPRSSGQRYGEVIHYMEKHKRCGVVCCVGALGGMPQKLKIKPTTIGLIATSRGLFLRNIDKKRGLFLPEVIGLPAGLEETAASFPIVDAGFFAAKQFFNPTLLRNVTKLTADQPTDSIHNSTVIEGSIQKWVRDKWMDHTWMHESRRFPPQLHLNFYKGFGVTMNKVAANPLFCEDYQ